MSDVGINNLLIIQLNKGYDCYVVFKLHCNKFYRIYQTNHLNLTLNIDFI